MFIRRYRYTRKDGSKACGHILLENHRFRGKFKQRTLLNLGKDFNVPKEHWQQVTREVVNRLRGTPTTDQEDFAYKEVVKDLADRLDASGYKEGQKPIEYLIVEPNFAHEARSVGGERLCLKALRDLGLMKVLRKLGFQPRAARICAALVVARMLSPGHHPHRWMKKHSAIWELLGLHKRPPSESTAHRHVDRLVAQKDAIMNGVCDGATTYLGLRDTIYFYHLTRTHRSGHKKAEQLVFNYQGRYDHPLMVMVMDASGFPRSVDFLASNVNEPGTLKDTLERPDAAYVVMDAHTSTEADLKWLRSKQIAL